MITFCDFSSLFPRHVDMSVVTSRLIFVSLLVTGFVIIYSHQSEVSASVVLKFCDSSETTNESGEIWEVASQSMLPTLDPGDLVAVDTNASFNDVGVGDIILFNEPIPLEYSVIISRVVEVLTDPYGDLVVVTKGDANLDPIPGVGFPVHEADFMGKVKCISDDS